MENKLNKLFYVVLTTLASVMLIEMWGYGWNGSLFIYFFPFNVMQPLRIHYITVIVCAVLMVFNLNFYRNVEFLRSLILSTLSVLLGLSGFELMWHYGRGWGYGVGPGFWLFYLLMAFLCFTYGQYRWVKKLSLSNSLIYASVYCALFLIWVGFSATSNFYPSLLLYDAHTGPNPHSLGFFAFKSIVLL